MPDSVSFAEGPVLKSGTPWRYRPKSRIQFPWVIADTRGSWSLPSAERRGKLPMTAGVAAMREDIQGVEVSIKDVMDPNGLSSDCHCIPTTNSITATACWSVAEFLLRFNSLWPGGEELSRRAEPG